MAQTTNYALEKPAATDYYDIGVHNANMDKIDAQMKANADEAAAKAATDHVHGNITKDGKIGDEADLPVFTGEGGAVGTKSADEARGILGAYAKPLRFLNTVVSTADWTSDSTYTGYLYRKAIPLTGVTADMLPDVILAPADATGGKIGPVAVSYNGGIYIYAKVVPSAAITIPTITLWAGV